MTPQEIYQRAQYYLQERAPEAVWVLSWDNEQTVLVVREESAGLPNWPDGLSIPAADPGPRSTHLTGMVLDPRPLDFTADVEPLLEAAVVSFRSARSKA